MTFSLGTRRRIRGGRIVSFPSKSIRKNGGKRAISIRAVSTIGTVGETVCGDERKEKEEGRREKGGEEGDGEWGGGPLGVGRKE